MNYKDWTFSQWLVVAIIAVMTLLGILGAIIAGSPLPLLPAGIGVLLTGFIYGTGSTDFFR